MTQINAKLKSWWGFLKSLLSFRTAWGGVHGLVQIVENIVFGKKKHSENTLFKWIRILIIFAFVAFAWIFFVSNSMSDAYYVITHLFNGIRNPIVYLCDGFAKIGLGKVALLQLSISLLMLFSFDYVSLQTDVIESISGKKKIIRWLIYIIFILWTFFNVPYSSSMEFIYFQF